MNWKTMIAELERQVAASEERTQKLRRMLQDARELQPVVPPSDEGNNDHKASRLSPPSIRPQRRRRSRTTNGPTIKDLMIQVLRDEAEASGRGLSPIEMRKAILEKGRDVNRKSISAQLTHMKADHEVVHDPISGKWRLAE